MDLRAGAQKECHLDVRVSSASETSPREGELSEKRRELRLAPWKY